MSPRALCFAGMLLALAPLARAQGPGVASAAGAEAPGATRTPPASPPAAPAEKAPAGGIPAAALELLDTTADGKPVIDPPLRAYFDSLPGHAQILFASAVESGMIGGAAHARVLIALRLDSQSIELLLGDNCILCHTNPDEQPPETLFTLEGTPQAPHLALREVVSDLHFRRGLSCSGCHGGTPADTEMVQEIYDRWPSADERDASRAWVPAFCARCHSDPAFMRNFNPGLPTDQLSKYQGSRHGQRLLGENDSRAAECVSCHGVHGIRSAKSRRSKVHPQNIPSTCGGCHASPEYMKGYTLENGAPLPTNQLAEYTTSVHGQALARGDLGAPACNDCHGNHAAMPPQVASVAQICRNCHSQNGALFDGSSHKLAFEEHGWPECGQCHGNHAIARASDDMLSVAPGGLCHDCHQQYAPGNDACMTVPVHFRRVIGELAGASDHFSNEVEDLAERGLDTDSLAEALTEIEDGLKQARSRVHAFDQTDFDQTATPALAAVARSQELVTAARREFRFRSAGLIVAMGLMSLLALSILLKLRQIEKR